MVKTDYYPLRILSLLEFSGFLPNTNYFRDHGSLCLILREFRISVEVGVVD